jgi:hypothetical protein
MRHKQASINLKTGNIFSRFAGHYEISKRTRQGQIIHCHVQLAFTLQMRKNNQELDHFSLKMKPMLGDSPP